MKKPALLLLFSLAVIFLFSTAVFAAEQDSHSSHPLCGPACSHNGDEVHANLEWTMLTKSNVSRYGLKSGNYYLGEDLNLTYSLLINGTSVNLCLNGKTLTNNGSSSAITVKNNGFLNLTDCTSSVTEGYISDELWTKGQPTSSYAAKINLTGGIVTGGSYVFGGGLNIISGTVHMYGGNIAGNEGIASNSRSHGGGGVYNEGTFFLHGGTICGNRARTSSGYGDNGTYYVGIGCGVYNLGTFEMSGGSINFNYGDSNGWGGGLYNSGTASISGGSIYKNADVMDGGGIENVGVGILTVSGGSISENTCRYEGGGVQNYGIFTMNGGTITNNKNNQDFGRGGGVSNDGTFTMNGGKISGNTAKNYYYSAALGGGVYNKKAGTFVMTGGEISGNTAISNATDNSTAMGGGVFSYGPTILTGGKICVNTAVITNEGGGTSAGGGIYIDSTGSIHVSGTPEVTGNTCNGVENNLYLSQEQAVTVGTDLDSNGVTEYLAEGAVLHLTSGTVPVEEHPFTVTTEAAVDYSRYFFADDPNYQIVASGSEDNQVVQLVPHFSHIYDKEDSSDSFLAEEATCQHPAIYYKSCFCGAVGTETFEHGDTIDHSFTVYHTNHDATCLADGTETAHCDFDGCQETDTRTVPDSKTEHPYSSWTTVTPATYTEPGKEERICTQIGCSTVETRITPPTGPDLLKRISVVYDGNTHTLYVINVPKDLSVVLALYDNGKMIRHTFHANAPSSILYDLPKESTNLTGKLFFLAQNWKPIGICTDVVF